MPDCRVEIIEGEEPICLIAPHIEEDHCNHIVQLCAEKLNAYAVINQGWERAETVDYLNDKANCNDLDHLLGDEVLKDEFLMPLTRFASQIRKQNFINIYVFIIHGFGAPAGKPDTKPDLVLGTGIPDRLTCDLWRRNAFAYYLMDTGLDVREGDPNGRFGGRSRTNLNQFFKRKTDLWYKDHHTHSFQVEIEHAWRKSRDTSRVVAEAIWKSIEKVVDLGDEGFDLDVDLKAW